MLEDIMLKDITVSVENITKAFGKKKVLEGASFEAYSGECVGIIGMNGSGKTTLFNIIAAYTSSDSGTVKIYGETITKLHSSSVLGYIPQENPLIEDLSAMDNLKLWYCDSHLNLKEELTDGVLHTLGIHEFTSTLVKNLSGGMKKRLSIGIAMASSPKVLLLDEPGAALDILAKETIRTYLSTFAKDGGTVIIATHDEEELSLCNKLLVMKDGILKEISPSLRGKSLVKEIL